MNKKFFERYSARDRYWKTFLVVSDGEITPEPEWREAEESYPEYTLYQCHNPGICVEDYMEKQRRVDELRSRLEDLKDEQSILKGLLASIMPIDQPVLFGEIVVTMDEIGVVSFQKTIKL